MLLPLPKGQVTSFQTWVTSKKPRTGSHSVDSPHRAFDFQISDYANDDSYFGAALILNYLLPDSWAFLFYDDNGTAQDKGMRHFHIQFGGWSGWEFTEDGVRKWREPGRMLQREYLKKKYGYFRNAPIRLTKDPVSVSFISKFISPGELATLNQTIDKFNSDLFAAYEESPWSSLPSTEEIKDASKTIVFVVAAVAILALTKD